MYVYIYIYVLMIILMIIIMISMITINTVIGDGSLCATGGRLVCPYHGPEPSLNHINN